MTTSALVTGASSGIGYAVAQRLLEAGHPVVVNARDADRLAAAADRLAEFGRVITVAGDAADAGTVSRMAEAAASLGAWGIAVANAGGGDESGPVAELDPGVFTERYRTNALPTALLLAAAARQFTAGGRFVAVASLAGRRGSFLSGPDYSAAKGAVLALVRHAALELAGRGITVNAVAPGLIDVPRMTARLRSRPASEQAQLLARIPAGRPGTPDEVAAAVCFLASADAGYITGATLDVNGGMYMA